MRLTILKSQENTPKAQKNNPVNTKRILNAEIYAKWGQVFTFSFPGARFA